MKLLPYVALSLLCAGALGGCGATDGGGGSDDGSDASSHSSDFSASVDGPPVTLAVNLEGFDTVTINAVEGSAQSLGVTAVSQWSYAEPTMVVDSTGDHAWLKAACEHSGELNDVLMPVDGCTADIQLTIPAGTGLLVNSLTEVRLTTQGITGDQSFILGDASTVTVADAGGNLQVTPAETVVSGIASVVGTGLRSEKVKVSTATMLGFSSTNTQVSLSFATPPSSLEVSAINEGSYQLEVPRLAPDGTEVQYLLGGSSVDCEMAVNIVAEDSGGVIASSDGGHYIYLSCFGGNMALDYAS